MINTDFTINASSVNAVKAKVDLYHNSTLVKSCTCGDILQDFTVDRVEESSKFFGFGICQKITVNLIDLQRELDMVKGDVVEVALGESTNFVYPYPSFIVEEVTRNEDTNSIALVAYDNIYRSSNHTISEMDYSTPYTIEDLAFECAAFIGCPEIKIVGVGAAETCFNTSYESGANLDGTESIRQILDDIAEATQTIYYIDNENALVFKRLDILGDPVATITKNDYFSLKTGANITIDAICHTTELGDNVRAGAEDGITQYVRDNAFWELRDDIGTLLDSAYSAVEGLSINQFICSDWIGNYLIEIGDKIALETEDGGIVVSYLLNDTTVFDGTLAEATQWLYEPNESESASNPSGLGEVLNQTRAKVDKANREISLVASVTNANASAISALQINTESISASVKSVEETTQEALGDLNEEVQTLAKEVSLKVSAEDVTLVVQNEVSKGVDVNGVTTSTGYTFNAEGLSISKSDSEIETKITENGMTVTNGNEEVLVANNRGVIAEDLHATTYLIIGNNSRLEDWGKRTACFWIG